MKAVHSLCHIIADSPVFHHPHTSAGDTISQIFTGSAAMHSDIIRDLCPDMANVQFNVLIGIERGCACVTASVCVGIISPEEGAFSKIFFPDDRQWCNLRSKCGQG